MNIIHRQQIDIAAFLRGGKGQHGKGGWHGKEEDCDDEGEGEE
jgi:hypothetical protein